MMGRTFFSSDEVVATDDGCNPEGSLPKAQVGVEMAEAAAAVAHAFRKSRLFIHDLLLFFKKNLRMLALASLLDMTPSDVPTPGGGSACKKSHNFLVG